jgi:SHAQKYF class myb-like DNA-binding protein
VCIIAAHTTTLAPASACNSQVSAHRILTKHVHGAGQKGERTAPKSWSEEEETKFQQALELHGRNWKACSEHIGSRDARAVASHAQKAFIRMCLAGQPLPAKVAETGLGWTLSGKLLDPNSSAARAYGFRKELLGSTWLTTCC